MCHCLEANSDRFLPCTLRAFVFAVVFLLKSPKISPYRIILFMPSLIRTTLKLIGSASRLPVSAK